jgi:hypothetical protein
MEYQPLREGEIRLLSILQPLDNLSGVKSGVEQDFPLAENVHCKLFQHTIQDCRPSATPTLEDKGKVFLALSYTWGSAYDEEVIFVNDKKVKVRGNLKKALEALRETDLVKIGCMCYTGLRYTSLSSVRTKAR